MRPIVEHWLARFIHPDLAGVLAPTWFMCIGIAGLVSLGFMLVLAKRRGLEPGTVASAVFWGYFAAVLAGIVVPMTIETIVRLVTTGQLAFRWAGMTSFWGYLAGAAAITLVCKRDGVPLARMADLVAMPIGIALVFARLGCFVAGCDYGKVTSLPWAVRFPAGSPAWRDQLRAGLIPPGRLESLPVHPTQLYEAGLGLVIVVVAYLAGRRGREGRAFLAAAATYAIGRLLVETLRGDAGRGVYAGLSSGQIFSLLVLLALALKFASSRRMATVATLLALVGNASAQPVADDPPPPPAPVYDVPPQQPEVRPLRPLFAVGMLLGESTSANRSGDQVPDLSGATLSLGYIPGRFGVWLDYDRFSNTDATHDSAIASVSFIPRVTPHLWIGVRAGLGFAHVSFMDPQFANITASDFRIDATAEVVMAHNWVLWVRPLSVDVINAQALGGPITTLQFRAGIAYRFGERGPAMSAAPPPPALPVLQPTFEGTP